MVGIMARRYVFADEAGDFDFVRKAHVSQYFILCAISMDSCDIGHALLELRRELIWNCQQVGPYFHASEDRQAVRDKVFALIRQTDIRIHATVMEKSKAIPRIRESKERFYQYGWFYLFKYIANKIVSKDYELMVTTASMGTKKGQATFTACVNDVLQQTVPLTREQWKTSFCPAAADPCLQIADYCAWAIQRKWESGGKDKRSYDLIANQISYEYDLWAHGTKHHY